MHDHCKRMHLGNNVQYSPYNMHVKLLSMHIIMCHSYCLTDMTILSLILAATYSVHINLHSTEDFTYYLETCQLYHQNFEHNT